MISWRLKTRSLRPIGLDIGHDSIKMIQLAVNNDRVSVIAADKVRVDANINGDGEERRRSIVAAIKRMLAKGGFRGRNVVSCLPNDRLKITSLRLAEAETDQIEHALTREAVHRFGLNPDKDTVKYIIAGSVRQGDEIKNELILFATDGETLKSHIALLEEAQLRPVAIDNVPCALFRSFERSLRRQDDREHTLVFVDVGSRFTTLVFGRGTEICFIKQINIGGEKFNREIAARLGINTDEVQILRSRLRMERGLPPPWSGLTGQAPADSIQRLDASTRQTIVDATTAIAEKLAREITLCLRYYTVTFRGKSVEKTFLSGGQAYEDILLDVLAQRLNLEVEVARPLRGFDMKNVTLDVSEQDLFCEWAVAVGLSFKGCQWVSTDGGYRQVPQVERRTFKNSR